MRPAPRQAGFTLLELLVALVVLGFLLAGLTQGTRYGLRAGAAQNRLIESRGDLDGVDRALRRLLTQADPGDAQDDGPPLRGGPGTLLFRSALPTAASDLVRQPAEIALGVDAQHRFQLRWRPYLHARRLDSLPAPASEELLPGVERVEFAYWRDGWRRSWEESALPALIRIRLVFPPDDNRHWPDIVVAPVRQRRE